MTRIINAETRIPYLILGACRRAAEGVILFILLNILAISQYVIFRKRLSYD